MKRDLTWEIFPAPNSLWLAQAFGFSTADGPDTERDCLINIAVLLHQARQLQPDISKMQYYILDEHNEPKLSNLTDWTAWQRSKPDVGVDYTPIGESVIGTSFQSLLSDNTTAWWFTEIIGGHFHLQRRTCSGPREHAQVQHNEMVKMVRDFYQR